ncbi:MAG TPA: hypothetical protein ENI23_04830 [bacterium]|nr:hypothetical protein [bacterium]
MDNFIVNLFDKLKKKYILELHWSGVRYLGKDGIGLYDAYFTGSVLSDTAQINPSDNITLDFSNMYHIFLPHFYLANLSWIGVDYRNNKVLLKSAVLKGEFITKLPKWNEEDYIIIDTSKHEEHLHDFNLTYDAFVVNKEGEVYDY